MKYILVTVITWHINIGSVIFKSHLQCHAQSLFLPAYLDTFISCFQISPDV